MEPSTAYHLILGLVLMNDWAVFHDVASKHPQELPATNGDAYREIGEALTQLLDDYDFTESEAFQRRVAGKGAAYVEATRRFESDPVKRRAHREHLAEVLREFPPSSAVLELLSPTQHLHFERLVRAVKQLERAG